MSLQQAAGSYVTGTAIGTQIISALAEYGVDIKPNTAALLTLAVGAGLHYLVKRYSEQAADLGIDVPAAVDTTPTDTSTSIGVQIDAAQNPTPTPSAKPAFAGLVRK